MLRKLFSSVLVLVLLISSLAWVSGSVAAHPVSLPKPDVSTPCPPDGQWATRPGPAGQTIKIPQPCYPGGERRPSRPTGSPPLGPNTGVLTTGGPDDYGYTWNDGVAISWINASSGPNTGATNSSSVAGPFPIGFSFKYYENTYTQLWVGLSGIVGFNSNLNSGYALIPDPPYPNDMLAPWLASLQQQAGNSASKVTYLAGGTAPNRYFVVQWNQITDGLTGNTFTFQAVLRESSNAIDFQYLSMTYGAYYPCPTIGIENSLGSDGLSYSHWPTCPFISSNKAIRFSRPATSARVGLFPPYQGAFTHAGDLAAFQVSLRNLGELGSDTYDLTSSSAWPISFYASDGSTALTDTNSNTTVDTGSLAEGQLVTLTVKIQTPITATLPEANPVVITATSALNPSKSQAVNVQTAVPAPFAQAYQDWDLDGAMRLYLAHPAGQADVNLTPDYEFHVNPVIAAANGNTFYAWETIRCLDFNCDLYVNEIEATLRNNIGDVIKPAFRLADHSGAKQVTLDVDPAVAGAPDGSIGVLWSHTLYSTTNLSQFNSNLFFAILDANGNIVSGPTNLTNNTLWNAGGTLNVPSFYWPHLTATGNNRFIITWVKEIEQSGGPVDDIWYTIRSTTGSQVKALTQFTNDTPGYGEGFLEPNVTPLTGNRALLTWDQMGDVYYAVLDSSGNTVKGATNLANNGGSVADYGPDAVQLSDGKTVVAWTEGETTCVIRFAVLADSPSYTLLAGPTTLTNPAALTGDDNVSVAADAAGHAILTWMDRGINNRNLYYTLLDSNGNTLAPPMIFRTSPLPSDFYAYLLTNSEGYGNTAYSLSPSANADGVASFTGLPTFYTPPGMSVDLNLRYTNVGLTPATGAVLTATLANDLTYLSDTSGLTATVNGNLITWYPSDIKFLGGQQFELQVDAPITATSGTLYPLALTLTSNGPEANAVNNSANAQLLILYQLFLPLLRR